MARRVCKFGRRQFLNRKKNLWVFKYPMEKSIREGAGERRDHEKCAFPDRAGEDGS